MTFYRGSGSSGKTQKHKITGQPRSRFSFTDGMGEGPEADKLKFNVIQMGRNKVERAVVDIPRDKGNWTGPFFDSGH